MSFLLRTLPRRTLTHSPLQTRLLTTSSLTHKSATDTAKETLESVNRKVGDAAVKGIEKSQEASSTVKGMAGVKAGEAKGEASEMKGKASEMSGELKGKASEMAGEAKGKMGEVKGEAKGKAEEVKGKM